MLKSSIASWPPLIPKTTWVVNITSLTLLRISAYFAKFSYSWRAHMLTSRAIRSGTLCFLWKPELQTLGWDVSQPALACVNGPGPDRSPTPKFKIAAFVVLWKTALLWKVFCWQHKQSLQALPRAFGDGLVQNHTFSWAGFQLCLLHIFFVSEFSLVWSRLHWDLLSPLWNARDKSPLGLCAERGWYQKRAVQYSELIGDAWILKIISKNFFDFS